MINRAVDIEYKKKNKKKSGRPPAMTPDTLSKIEYAAGLGCSVNEICLYSGISTTTYYKYMSSHADYKDYIDMLRDNPVLLARQNIIDSIRSGDPVTAKWYLERRAPAEFTVKHDITLQSDHVLSIEDRSKALSDFLRRFTAEH